MPQSPSWSRRSRAGIAVGFARTAVTESAGFAALIVLSRVLGVDDFGRYGVAIALIILVRLLALGGLSLAITRRPRGAHPRTLSGVVWVEVIVAVPLAGALVALGMVLGGAWAGLMAGVAVAALLVPAQLPTFLEAYRHMRFGRLAVIQTAEALPLYGGVIIIALLGGGAGWFGVAFAVSALVGAAVARALGGPMGRPANLRAGWRALAMAGHDHAFIVISQALVLVMIPFAALVGGAALAGEIRWGASLAAPIALLSGLVIPVVYVPLARMGTAALRANARMVIRIYGITIGALAAALAPALAPLVPIVFGPGWAPVISVGQASVLLLALIAVMELLRSFIQGAGRTRAVTAIQAGTLVASLGALAIGSAAGSALLAMLFACAGVLGGIACMAIVGIDIIGVRAALDLATLTAICAAAALVATLVPAGGVPGAALTAMAGAALAAVGSVVAFGPRFVHDARAVAMGARGT